MREEKLKSLKDMDKSIDELERCDLCGRKIPKNKLIRIHDNAKPDGINILTCPVCHEYLYDLICDETKYTKMQFKIPCVFDFLRKNGFVFSVRGYDMKDKFVEVEGIGKCWRKKIREVSEPKDLADEDVLDDYAEFSGFRFSLDWWSVIEKFCKRKSKFLYLVMKVE
jgi:ribosomal protein S26